MSHCIIHYNYLDCKSVITPWNEQSFNTLESKKARLLLCGDRIHQPQIDNLPKVDNEGTNHGYHRECYQKATSYSSIKGKCECKMCNTEN